MKLLAIGLCCITTTAIAATPLDLAREQALLAHESYSLVISKQCKKKRLITAEQLKTLTMTQVQWRAAYLHLLNRARQRCAAPWAELAEIAIARYFWLAEQTPEQTIAPVVAKDGTVLYSSKEHFEIMFYIHIQDDLERQITFETLPKDMQKRLLVVPWLQQPFNAMKAMDKLK